MVNLDVFLYARSTLHRSINTNVLLFATTSKGQLPWYIYRVPVKLVSRCSKIMENCMG